MKRSSMILIGIAGAFALFILWAISINNSLVGKEESIKGSWAQVENVYQRRMDLIPNLVNTVKGYARHERETLEGVIQARNMALQAAPKNAAALDDQKQLKNYQQSQDALSGALGRLLVVVEKYPDLKANENFRDLQSQLEGTENRIAVERRRFNEVTQDYNSYIRRFPQAIIAGFRGFKEKAYFEAQQGAATAPKVEF